jgi:hypothetical protein
MQERFEIDSGLSQNVSQRSRRDKVVIGTVTLRASRTSRTWEPVCLTRLNPKRSRALMTEAPEAARGNFKVEPILDQQ